MDGGQVLFECDYCRAQMEPRREMEQWCVSCHGWWAEFMGAHYSHGAEQKHTRIKLRHSPVRDYYPDSITLKIDLP